MVTNQTDALHVEGLVNLRGLGGLPIEGGGETRFGRLLRSDSPHRLDESGARLLADAGVSTVVDLRTASEREDRPNLLVRVADIECVSVPIFTDATEFPRELVTATDVYSWWLRDLGAAIKAAMAAIADAPTAPVLVHCHAGKDRTGVVVALALLLAGVGADAIADDYALSGVQLADMLARDRVSAVEGGMDEVRVERLFTVRREAMVETVERIVSNHGGAARYLAGLGMDDERIDRLRRLLVAPEWP
ncbi:MAG TPA: tyrosine-protein phosphatase [Candidatus Deferrimicrobium sp.]|nr:tyrosine-protein phosphatase [Candidatus Deferrimicrobium sp.]